MILKPSRQIGLIGCALTILICFTSSSPANSIVDPGFETPVLPVGASQTFAGGSTIGPWTVLGVDVLLLQTNYGEPGNGVNPFNAQEGLNSVDLTGSGNTGPTDGVQQTISTLAGTNYLLSFYVGRATGGSFYSTPATVNLSINGGTAVAFTNSNSTPGMINWQQFSTSLLATGSLTTIAFLNGTPLNTSEAGLDNVVVVPAAVPEPASLLILSSGLVSILGARWHRGRRTAARRSRAAAVPIGVK
jgi:hypothetical protein